MRHKLFRWPVIVAAICGLLIFLSATFITAGTASAQEPAQDETSPTINCEILSGNPLNWFGCPIVTGLQEAVTGLNAGIDYMLTIKTEGPGGLFTEPGYRRAWDSFRVIAIGLIIVAGLVMLASQAFGFEIFDAYTVKKLMPRLVISVIFIVISWDLLQFLVTMSNVVGNSVRALIYQPFLDLNGSPYADALEIGNWTKFLLALITGAAIASLGLAALLSFVVTAALAVALAFIILLIRQMIVVLLVIFAPVAIALYVLPGTQKAFDFWKGTLISMLVVFPIISGMIAVGRVFALIAYGSPAGGGIQVIQQLSAFAAYFMPYFLLPFAFRLAGGAIATLSGIVNDRGRGAFDRVKGYRGKKVGENFAAMKAGERYKGNNLLSRGFNRTTFAAGLGAKNQFGLGARGKSAAEQRRTILAGQHAKTDEAQAAQYNDGLLQAQTYTNENAARAGLRRGDFGQKSGAEVEDMIAAAKANGGFSQARQMYAANQLAATGTGYENQEQMLKTIARASNGNSNTAAALVGSARGAGEKAGRYDLKSGFNTQLGLVNDAMKNGGHIDQGKMLAADIEAVQGASAAQRAQSKPTATKNAVKNLNTALGAANNLAKNPEADFATRRAAQEQAASIVATMQNMEGAKFYGPEAYTQALYNPKTGLESSQRVEQNIQFIQNRIQTPQANQANADAQKRFNQESHNYQKNPRVGAPRPGDPNDPNIPNAA